MKNFTVKIGKNNVGNHLPLTLISGPCDVESFQHALEFAGKIIEICSLLDINFIYTVYIYIHSFTYIYI